MWRSHDEKQAKSAHNKGDVGRLIAIDPWGNGTSILIAKGTDFQDPELVHGLQPKIEAVDCLRLSKPRIVPDEWSRDAVQKGKIDGSVWILARHNAPRTLWEEARDKTLTSLVG